MANCGGYQMTESVYPSGDSNAGREMEGFRLRTCQWESTGHFKMRDCIFTDEEHLFHRKTIMC